jgi:hypothetical protein
VLYYLQRLILKQIEEKSQRSAWWCQDLGKIEGESG